MYLYSSEHALMDYHLNDEKTKIAEAEKLLETHEENGISTD